MENWIHSNQEIKIKGDDSVTGEEVVIRGISKNGFLLAEGKEDGGMIELQPDGNSLDMLEGLIKTKTI